MTSIVSLTSENIESTWDLYNEGFFDLNNIFNLIGLHSLYSLCGLYEAKSLFLEETIFG